MQIKSGRLNASVEVSMEELETKARELNVFDLKPFYNSILFKQLGFHIDLRYHIIVKTY